MALRKLRPIDGRARKIGKKNKGRGKEKVREQDNRIGQPEKGRRRQWERENHRHGRWLLRRASANTPIHL